MPSNRIQLRFLVVDDDDAFRDSLAMLLRSKGHGVVGAIDLASARAALAADSFDAVLVDQQLPDGEGSLLLEDPLRPPETELVVITGHATVREAVASLQRGATDYITKPIDPVVLDATLSRLMRVRELRHEVDMLRGELRERGRFGPLVGRSKAMEPVIEMIQRVAPTDASVLIQGESGTGKEMVAQAIHEFSGRKSGPMIAVNCGAISENLIESELFGHEKGSFTGADRQHRGFFERANGGTLFLDEITEMPALLQVKLLRVLESGHVQRVGGTNGIETDVRLIAATNRDPEAAIREGKLREDLFFRLAVFPILLPPLRDRVGDIALLSQHFLDSHNRANNTDKRWADGALGQLARLEWRGNVRELRNAVQRAYILADDTLRAEDSVAGSRYPDVDLNLNGALAIHVGSSIAEVEQLLIRATLEQVAGDKPQAARILGISLKTLYNRLNVYRAAGVA
jgi:DNA-binding NtrC family response regulator